MQKYLAYRGGHTLANMSKFTRWGGRTSKNKCSGGGGCNIILKLLGESIVETQLCLKKLRPPPPNRKWLIHIVRYQPTGTWYLVICSPCIGQSFKSSKQIWYMLLNLGGQVQCCGYTDLGNDLYCTLLLHIEMFHSDSQSERTRITVTCV